MANHHRSERRLMVPQVDRNTRPAQPPLIRAGRCGPQPRHAPQRRGGAIHRHVRLLAPADQDGGPHGWAAFRARAGRSGIAAVISTAGLNGGSAVVSATPSPKSPAPLLSVPRSRPQRKPPGREMRSSSRPRRNRIGEDDLRGAVSTQLGTCGFGSCGVRRPSLLRKAKGRSRPGNALTLDSPNPQQD